MSLLVFDIESRVDKALLRATQFAAQAISDDEAYERMRDQLRHETGGRSDFFPVTYHVPISIALVSAADDGSLRAVTVLGADQLGEEGLVREFWRRLEAFDGTLVSFNGRGFDLPVLELQALRYGCALPRYFDRNGLRQRFGRHLDLQDWMANFGAARLRGGLNLIAKLIGLPGKGEVGGADVQRLWERGRWTEIHRYCADDAVQTYFVMLRVEQLRGRLTAAQVASLTAAAPAKLVRSGGLQPATPGPTATSVAGQTRRYGA